MQHIIQRSEPLEPQHFVKDNSRCFTDSQLVANPIDNFGSHLQQAEAVTCMATQIEQPHAVIDTGCQKTAVGSQTLKRIAQQLGPNHAVHYQQCQTRFRGVGGTSVSNYVARIPIGLGRQYQGYLHAAVLEDCSEAPLLISLPVLQGLKTVMNLEENVIGFESLGLHCPMDFNSKGQMCLTINEFPQGADS